MKLCVICNKPNPNDSKDSIPIHRECWDNLIKKEGVQKALERVHNGNKR